MCIIIYIKVYTFIVSGESMEFSRYSTEAKLRDSIVVQKYYNCIVWYFYDPIVFSPERAKMILICLYISCEYGN